MPRRSQLQRQRKRQLPTLLVDHVLDGKHSEHIVFSKSPQHEEHVRDAGLHCLEDLRVRSGEGNGMNVGVVNASRACVEWLVLVHTP